MGTDHYAGLHGFAAGAADDRGIAGVETAGHVGAGHGLEHRRVVAQRPAAEGLADVAV